MKLGPDALEQRFGDGVFGLSARRLWEHTELGQINVFAQAISARPELNDAASFIDVVRFDGNVLVLSGFTLADLRAGRFPGGGTSVKFTVTPELTDSPDVAAFVRVVADHVARCSIRQATRNQHRPFLPNAQAGDAFGVPLIFSTLRQRLEDVGRAKASAGHWRSTIENFQTKGLRAEELERSNVLMELAGLDDTAGQISAATLADRCSFEALRLSVIPVVNAAQRQLRFTAAPGRSLKRTMKLPRAQHGQSRIVVGYDPILGYRIEQVEHQTLWGRDRHWQAVTHDGQVIRNTLKQILLTTEESAAALASSHALQHFPKRVALGRWGHIAWTGGEEYREWLITVPWYPGSFFSSHFVVRNVLAHVRCDIREGADGDRVLLLQEVQSDWAQIARRAIAMGEMVAGDDQCPPFLKEWPVLAMKLVLLHAAHEGVDAVAWTRGAHQAFRYKGLGATGLAELYDRTLPREVGRLVKPFGGGCEKLGVFVPANFRIKQSEDGYEVYTPENELLGTAPTLEDAREYVPNGAHELLYEVHGVSLSGDLTKKILSVGFPAWG